MKYVTRAHARVDRIACPWLIKRFIDPGAEFMFVEPERVLETAQREGAVPFDVPDVELGHHGDRCSFDAIIEKHGLRDPALLALADIVRGADTSARALTPESAGLYAIAIGFAKLSPSRFIDDHALLAVQSLPCMMRSASFAARSCKRREPDGCLTCRRSVAP